MKGKDILKNHILFRTNALVCGIILVGFIITAALSYRANINTSVKSIEQVSELTSEGIYYQLASIFTKPVNVSLTMANDSLLKGYLAGEKEKLEDEEYVNTIKEYLDSYEKKYKYDSVFLISTESGRYYNFNGVDRIMTPDNPENEWYYNLLAEPEEYSLNVDNDEVENAENAITIFVNCKIKDNSGNVIGVVGVGQRIDSLQKLLAEYEEKFGVKAFLIDKKGSIEISTEYTGYEKVDLFETYKITEIRDLVLSGQEESGVQSVWAGSGKTSDKKMFLVWRYIPELSWHLVVERDMAEIMQKYQRQLLQSVIIIIFIVTGILYVITYVVKGFNNKIMELTIEKEQSFRKATEQMYDHIHEYNITRQEAAGESTKQYLESLGLPRKALYDEILKASSAEMKEEFKAHYYYLFNIKNVIREYDAGNTHLNYDYQMKSAAGDYEWFRLDAYIYYNSADTCIYMLVYRKNINEEKEQEKEAEKRAKTDEMTGFYNKMATQKEIARILLENPEEKFSFFIFDIDNFKQANDIHGHAFGDGVIIEFTQIIRKAFDEDVLLGRIGGDEFVAFAKISEECWVEKKAVELSGKLNKAHTEKLLRWQMAASIGISTAPKDGNNFEELYKKADMALYQTKERGKNGYSIWGK